MLGGFTSDDCIIDFDARTVTCPAAQTSRSSMAAALPSKDTAAQVLPSQCTTAVRGRKLSRNIHEQSLRAARALARDPDWRIPTAAAHGGTLDRLAHP